MKKVIHFLIVVVCCLVVDLKVSAQAWDVQVLNIGRIDGRLENLVDLLQVTVTSTAPVPVQTHMLLEITGNNGITFTTAPIYLDYEIPVNPGFQVFTVRAIQNFYQGVDLEDLLLANVSPSVIDYVTFERRLPPGQYQVCISVFDTENTMLRYGTSCSSITNNPKDPPVIMSPFELNQNGVLVNFNDPPNLMVNWIHPGVFGVDYTLEVKKLAGMKQLEAFNKQGRPQIYFEGLPDAIFPERDINNLSYIITQDNNPFFDEGDILAVRVIAQSPVGEFVNEGKSNIVVLILDGGNRLAGGDKLEQIPIDPQFAKLVNLGSLMVTDDQNTITFNGFADLEFSFPGMSQPTRMRANVMNLEVQKGSFVSPQVLGGYIRLDVGKAPFLPHAVSDLVNVKTIEWNYGQGFTVEADLRTPNGQKLEAEGTLQLFANGLSGWIETTATNEQGLEILDDGSMQLVLYRMVAQFPQLTVDGDVDVRFAHGIPGVRTSLDLEQKTFQIAINQPFYLPVDLVEGTTFGKAVFKGITGSISGSFQNKVVNFDVNLPIDVLLRLQNNNYCGMATQVGYNTGSGFSIGNTVRNCNFPTGILDLGFFQASYQNFTINKLQFPTPKKGWDFDLQLDVKLFSQANPSFLLPDIAGVRITPKGIAFPYKSFLNATLANLPPLDFSGYKLKIASLDISAFDFPVFSWDGKGIGPWELTFDGSFTPPSDFRGPECLQQTAVSLSNGRVATNSQGQYALQGTLALQPNTPCKWSFDNGFEISVSKLAGTFEVTKVQQQFAASVTTRIDGALTLGQGFDCGPQAETIAFQGLEVNFNNGITGVVSNLQSPCAVQIGPFEGTMSQTQLQFSMQGNEQRIHLQSGANLDLGEGKTAQGNFLFDVVNTRFDSVDFTLTGPFSWGLPKENPVVVFTISNAILNADGLFINGRNSLVAGGQTTNATFDNLLIDWDTYAIKSGRIVLDEAFTFVAGIDEQQGALQYGVTHFSDFQLPHDPGALLQLAGQLIIDSTGLKASGQALGKLKFGGYDLDSIQLVYTPDFTMGINPLAVTQGEASLFYQQQLVASVNSDGFFPNMMFFANEFLPEIIPLPTEDIGYLRVKENGVLIVNMTQEPNGTLLVETKPNTPLRLVIPALQGGNPQAPEVQVTLENLRINPATGAYISGKVIAQTTPGVWPGGNAANWPLELQQIVFETRVVDGGPIAALFFVGDLKIFDKVINSAEVRLGVQSDGRLSGAFDFYGINETFPLDGPGGKVRMLVDTLSGGFSIPLSDPAAGTHNLFLAGGVQVVDANQAVAFQAGVAIEVTEVDASLIRFDGATTISGQSIDMGPFVLTLERMNNLSINYNKLTGFDYTLSLDLSMGFSIENSDTLFQFPLDGVELRKGGRFVIPSQDVHSTPQLPLQFPSLRFGVFEIEPFAFRMERIEVNWNSFSPAQLAQFVPKIDLALRFPGVPQLVNTELTLQDFGLDNGLLNGDILPLDISHNPIFLPIGRPDMGIEIHEFAGSLNQLVQQVQNFDLRLTGRYRMPELFEGQTPFCDTAQVTLSLNRMGHVSGTVSNFLPCGQMKFGPIALGFTNSQLNLGYDGQQFSATLSGAAAARIFKANGDSIQATGNLAINLLTGAISDGEIIVTNPFTWHYPSPDSLFLFTVNQARINSSGIVFNGQGSLQVGNSQISVTFNAAGFSLVNYSLTSGDINFGAAFALDIYTQSPVRWELSDPNEPFQSGGSTGVRMTMPSQLTLDNQGFLLSGNTDAAMYVANEVFGNLRLEYHQARIAFTPSIGFLSGRADFIQEEPNKAPVRLAYYDSLGFHVDNIPNFIPIPDTLGLPSKEIAYMVLRKANGDFAVQTQISNGTVTLNTIPNAPIELVLPALALGGQSPKVLATFSNVVINSSFELVSGEIQVALQNNPLSFDNFPVEVTKLIYSKPVDQPYRMRAVVKLKLPEALDTLQLTIPDIALNANGFDCITVALGQVTETHQEQMGAPLTQHSYNNGDLSLTIFGAEVTLCTQGDGPQARISGLLATELFKRNPTDEATSLHFLGSYANDTWSFDASAQHLPDFKAPAGQAEIIIDSLGTQFTSGHFGVVVNGRLLLPDLLGTTQVGFKGLRLATNGIQLDQAAAQNMPPQSLSLFGQDDLLVVNQLGLSLTATNEQRVLSAILGGEINVFNQNFTYADLRIGSDGTFVLGQGGVNLVQAPGKNIIGDALVLKTLNIGVHENHARLFSSLEVNLPEPFVTNTNNVTVSVSSTGQVHVSDFNIEGTTPVAIGEVGQFQITQIGFQMTDVFNPTANNFKLFASAKITAASVQGGSAGNAKIEIGRPNGIEEAGVVIAFGSPMPTWQNIGVAGDFGFSNDFFNFNLTAGNLGGTCPAENGFVINVNASAGLTLNGFNGAITMEGICIDKTGVTKLGTVTQANLTVMDVISLEFGGLEWSDTPATLQLVEGKGSSDNPDTVTTSIEVAKYIRIGSSSISLASFSGGFNEILYYKTLDGGVSLSIDGVNLELLGEASLYASLKYEKIGENFEFKVAGRAALLGQSLAAMGYVRRQGQGVNQKIGFGVFVKASVSVPIVPSLVTMTEFGGGFFLNPQRSDFATLLQVAKYELANPNSVYDPESSEELNVKFAVILNAGIGIVGQEAYAVTAQALVVISNNSIDIDLRGTVLEQDGNIEIGAYFALNWKEVEIEAGAFVNVNYSVVNAEGQINFLANKENWQLSATIKADVLSFFNFDAGILLYNDGFMFDMGIKQNYDIWIIEVRSSFELAVWWQKSEQVFGAYTEISFKASLFKGIGSVEGNLKGAFISKPSTTILYAGARVTAKVIGIPKSVSVWAAVENRKFNGGRGTNSEYDRMVAEARGQLEAIEEGIEEFTKIIPPPLDVAPFSETTISTAGFYLVTTSLANQNQFLNYNDGLYNAIATATQRAKLQEVKNLITSQNRPKLQPVETAKTKMEVRLASLASELSDLYNRIKAIDTASILWEVEAVEALNGLDDMQSPIRISKTENQLNSFEVDNSVNTANISALNQLETNVEKLEQAFRSAIDSIQANIMRIDRAINQSMIITTEQYDLFGLDPSIASGLGSGFNDFITSGGFRPFDFGQIVFGGLIQPDINLGGGGGFGLSSGGGSVLLNPDLGGGNIVNPGGGILLNSNINQGDINGFNNMIPPPNFNSGGFGPSVNDMVFPGQSGLVLGERTRVHYQYTANDGAMILAEAHYLSEEYFAKAAAYHLSFAKWATESKMQHTSNLNLSQINALAEGILVGYIGGNSNFSGSSFSQLASRSQSNPILMDEMHRNNLQNVTAGTGYLIERMAGVEVATARANENTLFTDMGTNWSNHYYSNYFDAFKTRFREFWWQVPLAGFDSAATFHLSRVPEVVTRADASLDKLESMQADFADAIDFLYGRKAGLLTTLYGVYELYEEWREADTNATQFDGPSLAAISTARQNIGEMLMAPSIDNIAVSETRYAYYNKVTISWNATHPTGLIAENAYAFAPEGQLATSPTLAIGELESIDRFIYAKSTTDIGNKPYQIRIRSRAPSGNAISTMVTTTLYITGDTSIHGGTHNLGTERQITKPTTPVVAFPYYSKARAKTGIPFYYWTKEAGQIKFRVSASDRVNDIAKFEVRLGTTKGGNEIFDWKEIPGQRVSSMSLPKDTLIGSDSTWSIVNSSGQILAFVNPGQLSAGLFNVLQSNNGRQEITIRNLNLDKAQHYYVSVRATNGSGVLSDVYEEAVAVRLDTSRPSVPATVNQPVVMAMPVQNANRFPYLTATTAPKMQRPNSISPTAPQVQLSWGASQAEVARVAYYEVAPSLSSNPTVAFSDAAKILRSSSTAITLKGVPETYFDAFYFHVKAVSASGTTGEAVTYGPYTIVDPTRPVHPVVRGGVKNGNLGIWMPRPGVDPETYRLSRTDDFPFVYEYRFMPLDPSILNQQQDGRSVVITPPSETFTPDFVTRAWYGTATNENALIPAAQFLTLDAPWYGLNNQIAIPNVPLRVEVKAVNAQGYTSAIASSASLIRDITPPNVPVITASAPSGGNGSVTGTLSFTLSNLADSETGISKVAYRVFLNSSNGAGVPFVEAVSYVTPRADNFQISRSVSVNVNLIHRIEVRVTNGNGMEQTGSFVVPAGIIQFDPNTNVQLSGAVLNGGIYHNFR